MPDLKTLEPKRAWLGLFALWSLLLTGALAGFVGSPGILQALRLKGLLAAKEAQVLSLEAQVHALELEAARLERSRFTQQREIRKILGYAASDELIFDFTPSDSF